MDALQKAESHAKRNKFYSYFPDDGPLRRELYQKHLAFFRAGALHRERLALCANRVGKTEGMGGFEVTSHLTGRYRPWWEGKRFDGPINAWIAGKNNETTRDILQAKMLGQTVHLPTGRKTVTGTGLIPGDDIGEIIWKQAVDLVDKVRVKHYDVNGKQDGWSVLGIKSYQQGRGSFEGTEQHVIWLDEEPETDALGIYAECLTRTMTTDGIVLVTFTPLEGMSEMVMQFLPQGLLPQEALAAAM